MISWVTVPDSDMISASTDWLVSSPKSNAKEMESDESDASPVNDTVNGTDPSRGVATSSMHDNPSVGVTGGDISNSTSTSFANSWVGSSSGVSGSGNESWFNRVYVR